MLELAEEGLLDRVARGDIPVHAGPRRNPLASGRHDRRPTRPSARYHRVRDLLGALTYAAMAPVRAPSQLIVLGSLGGLLHMPFGGRPCSSSAASVSSLLSLPSGVKNRPISA